MKITLLLTVLVLFPGCQKPSAPKPAVDEPTFRKPTATEVFSLRSTCAEFGKKILEGNVIGSTLAQEQVSHYDPTTNRCYVELSVHMADLTVENNKGYYARTLYDGQTGEVLVAVSSDPKGKNTIFVKDEPNSTPLHAIAKIDTLMADDRKR